MKTTYTSKVFSYKEQGKKKHFEAQIRTFNFSTHTHP